MSKFTIEYVGDDKWFVDFDGLVEPERRIVQQHLCQVLFDRVRPKWRVGIVFHNDLDDRREIQWLDFMVWNSLEEDQYESFGYHLFSKRRLIMRGVLLETVDQAEEFIDLMEQHFTFYALQKDYT